MGNVIHAEDKFNKKREVANRKRGKPSGDIKPLSIAESRIARLKLAIDRLKNGEQDGNDTA